MCRKWGLPPQAAMYIGGKELHVFIISVVILDVALLLCGIYLNESASYGIVKYIPSQFSKNGSYRWYMHHFAFEKYIEKKYKFKYIASMYVFSAFIMMLSVTLYLFNQVIPSAIFMIMFIASLYGLVKYTIKFLGAL